MTDFGLSKVQERENEPLHTFCGTPYYLAPEMLVDKKGYGKEVDWWGLGEAGCDPPSSALRPQSFLHLSWKSKCLVECLSGSLTTFYAISLSPFCMVVGRRRTAGILVFEMLSGQPPFYSNNMQRVYEKIVSAGELAAMLADSAFSKAGGEGGGGGGAGGAGAGRISSPPPPCSAGPSLSGQQPQPPLACLIPGWPAGWSPPWRTEIAWPAHAGATPEVQDLVNALLQRDPARRLGTKGGAEEVCDGRRRRRCRLPNLPTMQHARAADPGALDASLGGSNRRAASLPCRSKPTPSSARSTGWRCTARR